MTMNTIAISEKYGIHFNRLACFHFLAPSSLLVAYLFQRENYIGSASKSHLLFGDSDIVLSALDSLSCRYRSNHTSSIWLSYLLNS